MLQAGLGGYGLYREDQRDETEKAEARKAMAAFLSGPAAPPAATAVPPSPAPASLPGRVAYDPTGDVPIGSSRSADDPAYQPPPQRLPASIRTNNPGAQWPGPSARAFASTGDETIGGGNRIAVFDNPEQGAAAQFHLLDRAYVGMPLSSAINKWSGGNNAPQYMQFITQQTGLSPDTVVTPELLRGPQGVALVKAMAQHEAGRPYPLSDDQWTGAQRAAFGGGSAASASPAASQAPLAAPGGSSPASGLAGIPADRRAMLVAMLNNRYTAPLAQSILTQMVSQQFTPSYDFKVAGDTLYRTSNREGTATPVGQALKPSYGVVGKDEFGNERYGWIDPARREVSPATTRVPTQGDPAIPPAPPGVDPKQWREERGKRVIAESMPASEEATQRLRREVQDLPSYKNLAQAAPVYRTMLEAAGRDNRAADVNLIYGMAKIMDPGSVVRESEMSIAQAVATMPQNLQAQIKSQLSATGRLDPEVRAAIMQEARSRIISYQGMFNQDAQMYRGIAQRGRMNEADVLPDFGEFGEYKPEKRVLMPDELLAKARAEAARRGLTVE
jgi:hypothetical protein